VTAIEEGAANQSEAKGAMQEMQMSLTDMIAGMIQAVIDADQAVTDDYLEAFTRYAFEKTDKGEQLQMVHFEMVDSDGTRQLVSIPKLSLLPLPVLHVQEATFDFEAQMSIRESTEEVKEKTEEEKEETTTTQGFTRPSNTTSSGSTFTRPSNTTSSSSSRPPDRVRVAAKESARGGVRRRDIGASSSAASTSSGTDSASSSTASAGTVSRRGGIRRRTVDARAIRQISDKIVVRFTRPSSTSTASSGPVAGAPTAGPTTTDTEQNINLKVHIKLEPSVLPNGMRGLLQETDRSFQIIRSD
jgi:hypothetical protein